MTIRSLFRKFKIRAKTLIFIGILTILEVVFLFWHNNWNFTIAAIIPLIQFILIFERREKWDKLSEEEKEKVLISEQTLDGFVKGIEKMINEGETSESILKKIKED